MNKRQLATVLWILLAGACFVMGMLSLAGVFSRAGANERLFFGIAWVLLGAGWLGRLYIAKKKWQRDDEENRSP